MFKSYNRDGKKGKTLKSKSAQVLTDTHNLNFYLAPWILTTDSWLWIFFTSKKEYISFLWESVTNSSALPVFSLFFADAKSANGFFDILIYLAQTSHPEDKNIFP